MTRIKPVGFKVLVLPSKTETQEVNGIQLGGNAGISEGTVAGSVSKALEDTFKVGDKVLYNTKAGRERISEGKMHVILDVVDIEAILEDI